MMIPADQCFRAVQAAGFTLDIVLRLIINLEFTFLDGAGKVIEQTFLIGFPLQHLLVVNHEVVQVTPPDHIAGPACPLNLHFGQNTGRIRAHPQPQPQVNPSRYGLNRFLKALKHNTVIILVAAVQEELVPLFPACDSVRFGQKSLDRCADHLKHPVAEFPAVEFIDGVKTLNIERQGIKLPVRMIPADLFSVFEEKAVAVQPGYGIFLRNIDQVPPFTKFYDPPHTGQYHFMHVIGLRNEIRCPQFQGAQFG